MEIKFETLSSILSAAKIYFKYCESNCTHNELQVIEKMQDYIIHAKGMDFVILEKPF